MSKIVIIVRNKPLISLVSLVISIISLISCDFEIASFGGSLFSGGWLLFVIWYHLLNFIATFRESLLLELYGLFSSLETRGTWVEFTFAKTSGTVTRDREKNWFPVFPVTIPETIAGRISAPVPFSFLKWRVESCFLARAACQVSRGLLQHNGLTQLTHLFCCPILSQE